MFVNYATFCWCLNYIELHIISTEYNRELKCLHQFKKQFFETINTMLILYLNDLNELTCAENF